MRRLFFVELDQTLRMHTLARSGSVDGSFIDMPTTAASVAPLPFSDALSSSPSASSLSTATPVSAAPYPNLPCLSLPPHATVF
jgi:hypothetical protein